MKRVRVVLVDDHPPVREGIATFINRTGSLQIVGSAGTCEEARRLVASLRPDVLVLDLSLPDGNGLDLVREITQLHTDTRVMVLTMHARRAFAEQAFAAGASGYLLKESTGERLIGGLERVARGETVLDPGLDTDSPGDGGAGADGAGMTLARLSPREREVFGLLVLGHAGKQIAHELGISPKTVDNHRARILEKLSASSVAELVRIAIRSGVIEP